MTGRIYTASARLDNVSARTGITAPGTVYIEFGDSDSYIETRSAGELLPLIKALVAAVRMHDPGAADDLLFDALFGDAAMEKIQARVREREPAPLSHVRTCGRCGTSSTTDLLPATPNFPDGRREFRCADEEACARRRAGRLSVLAETAAAPACRGCGAKLTPLNDDGRCWNRPECEARQAGAAQTVTPLARLADDQPQVRA